MAGKKLTSKKGSVSKKTDDSQKGEIILFQTQDGHTKVQVRFEDNSVWLSQKAMADLYQVALSSINEHLTHIYEEGELAEEATLRKFRIVQTEGKREVTREVDHYSLEAILAVGYRVRSHRGTQFRQWATTQLALRKETFSICSFEKSCVLG